MKQWETLGIRINVPTMASVSVASANYALHDDDETMSLCI